jgi:hypothetical protein
MLKTANRVAHAFDAAANVPRRSRRPVEWAREGELCVRYGDLVGALRCFQQALEVDIDCAGAWTGLSDVFTRMNDPGRADACLQVARLINRRSEAPVTTA